MSRTFTREQTLAYIERIKKRIKKATNWAPPALFHYKLGDREGTVRAFTRSEARSLIKHALSVKSTAGVTIEMRRGA